MEVLLNIYWTLNYSNPKNSSLDSILLLVTHVLLKNSSVLCLYFLILLLVGVCALSVHQKQWWKCWGVLYLWKHWEIVSISAGAFVFICCIEGYCPCESWQKVYKTDLKFTHITKTARRFHWLSWGEFYIVAEIFSFTCHPHLCA
jgi:hypothetical protein